MAEIYKQNGIEVSEGDSVSTPEYYDGERTIIKDTFFNFPTVRDGVKAYKLFIENNPRYREALDADSTEQYLERIQQAGYATDPNYAQSLMTDFIEVEESR